MSYVGINPSWLGRSGSGNCMPACDFPNLFQLGKIGKLHANVWFSRSSSLLGKIGKTIEKDWETACQRAISPIFSNWEIWDRENLNELCRSQDLLPSWLGRIGKLHANRSPSESAKFPTFAFKSAFRVLKSGSPTGKLHASVWFSRSSSLLGKIGKLHASVWFFRSSSQLGNLGSGKFKWVM